MCQHDKCENASIECVIPAGWDTDGNEYAESYEYFCPEHAREHGFCTSCGTFIAGWRDNSDYCENCEDQLRDDFEDDEEDNYNENLI